MQNLKVEAAAANCEGLLPLSECKKVSLFRLIKKKLRGYFRTHFFIPSSRTWQQNSRGQHTAVSPRPQTLHTEVRPALDAVRFRPNKWFLFSSALLYSRRLK